MSYDFRAIESRWQTYWDEQHTFRAEIDPERPKYYVLDMFPYPSGDGLHVGHPEGYTATDIVARYKRMRGFNVLHPMGWDAFGLPAERYAMKTGTHPAVRTAECIRNFKRQLKTLGFSYDWDREIDTTDPQYLKWTQWIFLQIWNAWYDHEQGRARPIGELAIPREVALAGAAEIRRYRDERRMAYLHEAPVNWCPELRVVLANEEVAEHVEQGYTVVRRPMRQWMLRITAYAERLLTDLDELEWSASVVDMQRHWIGRSDGAEVDFEIAALTDEEAEQASPADAARSTGLHLKPVTLTVFTTRPDTLFGATYMVLAPEHPAVAVITTEAQRAAVAAYVEKAARRSERERQADAAEGQKTGVFTGAYARNPANGERIPVWISDYVLMGYGTGAIMAVPGHDERDHAFATAMRLPIVEVVGGGSKPIAEAAFCEPGVAVRSGFLDGLPTAAAKARMIAWLEAEGRGRRRVTYKLRDWLFSRQRYWGEPFPLIHRPDGEIVAAELPVELPELADFQPSETGEPPLSKAEAWRKLPDGGLRETNTMPQWAGSCWYYLRFMDPKNPATPFSRAAADYWLPVDLYVGGAEHAVLHLLYARFWHKILFDLGYLGTKEPFQKLVNQGMVLGATFWPKDRRRTPDGKGPVVFKPEEVEQVGDEAWQVKGTGEAVDIQWDKMSKSRGNVVNPDDVIRQYGADTMRLYEMFMGPLEHSAPWQTEGVAGCHRFLQRVYRLAYETAEDGTPDRLRELPAGEGSDRQRRLLHRTIHAVRERIDRLAFNTAISAMMVFVRDIVDAGEPLHRDALAQFLLLLSPFAPHLAEELWRAIGHTSSLAHELWPAADESLLLDATWPLVVQVMGKRRAELPIPQGASEADITARVLADADVQRHLAGKAPRRVIYVPGKLINLVV
jgi:leucyl-tRNA synthetase